MIQSQEPIGPAVLAMVQAEFVAIRSEIGRLIDHQKDLQNLSLVSLGAVFGFVAAIAQLDPDENDVTLVLLLVPFLTLQFSLTAQICPAEFSTLPPMWRNCPSSPTG